MATRPLENAIPAPVLFEPQHPIPRNRQRVVIVPSALHLPSRQRHIGLGVRKPAGGGNGNHYHDTDEVPVPVHDSQSIRGHWGSEGPVLDGHDLPRLEHPIHQPVGEANVAGRLPLVVFLAPLREHTR